AAVAKHATVIRVDKDGSIRTLRSGSNGFTCMIMGTDKMCNDANSMEFIHAMMKHVPPPAKVGISYMLAGDQGASNTDPYATGKTVDNHWIVTGSAHHGLRATQQGTGLHPGQGPGSD